MYGEDIPFSLFSEPVIPLAPRAGALPPPRGDQVVDAVDAAHLWVLLRLPEAKEY